MCFLAPVTGVVTPSTGLGIENVIGVKWAPHAVQCGETEFGQLL